MIRKVNVVFMFSIVFLTLILSKTEICKNCNGHHFWYNLLHHFFLFSNSFPDCNNVCIHLRDIFTILWTYAFLCDFKHIRESILWNSLWMQFNMEKTQMYKCKFIMNTFPATNTSTALWELLWSKLTTSQPDPIQWHLNERKISPNKMETVGGFLKYFGKVDFLKVTVSAHKAIETGQNKIQKLQTSFSLFCL